MIVEFPTGVFFQVGTLFSTWLYSIVKRSIIQSRQFKCSLDYAKKSFFRSLNAIFGKISRNAPEEVILELIRSKYIHILYMA